MGHTRIRMWGGLVCLFCVAGLYPQNQPAGDGSASNSNAVAAVPRLIKFSGRVLDARGEPLTGVAVRLTFAVYEEQQGGAVLWAETQMVQLDEQGHYAVLLGATRADGLPVELFPAGKARWLGVQVEGRDEDSRVLLVSVPYALKAEDAAMLGGRQASDFVLGEQLKEEVRTQVAAQTPGIATQAVEMLVSNPPKVPAIAEGPSTFTCATTGDCVAVTQSGTGRALRTTATSASEAVLVQQNGTGYGLRALAPGNVALYGQITSSAGTSYGVKGLTTSTTGAGVFGYNLATTGLAYGVLGQTASTEGTAFFGRAVATTGATIGLRGHADSTSGTGIMGQATATSGTTTGIVGRVFSVDGTALVVDNTQGGKLLSGKVGSVEKFSVSGSGSVTAASFSGNGSGLTNLNTTNLYGVISITSSVVGVPGVTGTNTAATGDTNGVYGLAASTAGTGVYGRASAGTGDTNGVYGLAVSTAGTGVYGYASSGTGFTNGVYGSADSADGTGVFGYASSTTGSTDGVYGEAESPDGAGVYGRATADTGETYGLYGEAQSISGTGVLGYALSATGTTAGVTGEVESSAGVAGLFDNLAGGDILVGQTNGTQRFRVDGSGNVTATSFVGPLTGAASDLNCTGCVSPSEVSFNYAGSASQGGAATSALAATTATNALALGGLVPGAFELLANKNVANGYAGLDSSARIAKARAPSTTVYTDASNAFSTGTQNASAAGATLPVKSVLTASAPATCVANKELLIKTDAAPAGQQLFVCNGTGNGWNLVGDGAAGGVTSFNSRTGAVLPTSGDYGFDKISGTVGGTQLSGTYSSALTFSNVGNTISGNGSGLTNVDAATAATATNALNLGSVAASNFARRDTVNTFTDTQTVSSGNLSVGSGSISLPQTTSASAGVINLGGNPFIHACCSASQHNTFVGSTAGNFSTTGSYNTASGNVALEFNSTGGFNSAFGHASGFYNTTGTFNTFIGANAGPDSSHGTLTNATAIGAHAVVTASNSLVLGGTGDYAVNVGIGTEIPAEKLDVIGNIKASGSVSAASASISGGVTAASFSGDGSALTGVTSTGLSCTGCVGNTQLGVNYAASASQGGAASNALLLNGLASSAFQLAGSYATLAANTFTDTQAISSGNLALPQTASASTGVITLGGNRFIHACCSAAQYNTFAGSNAGNFSTTGSSNTAIGYAALGGNTTGHENTASGYGSLAANTEGSFNTADGYQALYANLTGGSNTASGWFALHANTTGGDNIASGYSALLYNTDGSYNTASGAFALAWNCYGVSSGCTAHRNTGLGDLAGVTSNTANANVTGANNTFLGAYSGPGTSTQLSTATAVGYRALVSASNALVLGGPNGSGYEVNVGIGTQSPVARLEVVDGDVYASTAGKGVIVKSPDGNTCARIGIDNSGALSVTALTCP